MSIFNGQEGRHGFKGIRIVGGDLRQTSDKNVDFTYCEGISTGTTENSRLCAWFWLQSFSHTIKLNFPKWTKVVEVSLKLVSTLSNHSSSLNEPVCKNRCSLEREQISSSELFLQKIDLLPELLKSPCWGYSITLDPRKSASEKKQIYRFTGVMWTNKEVGFFHIFHTEL